MPAMKKAFDQRGDNIVDLNRKKGCLKNKIGSYDENWIQGSETRLLQQIDDAQRTNLFTSRMKKRMNK